MSRPLVLAHRGACRQAPENTVAAFVRAAELGADGVELDVRRTIDGDLVVHHDDTVAGVGLIVGHDLAALRAVHADLPTLAEALDACAALAYVNVEMKCCAWDPDADPERVVARGVAAELARRGDLDRYVVSSFDLPMLDDFRTFAPEATTGWLTQGSNPAELVGTARERGHAWLHPDWGNLLFHLDASVAAARAHGVRLDPWTVDDADAIRKFAAAGVDAIITNEPDRALALLA